MREKEVKEVVSEPCRPALGPGEDAKDSRSALMDFERRRAELYRALYKTWSVPIVKMVHSYDHVPLQRADVDCNTFPTFHICETRETYSQLPLLGTWHEAPATARYM